MFLLASNSPRRKELFSLTGWAFESKPADVDESVLPAESPLDYVRRVSEAKARKIAGGENGLVVAADTIVVDGSEILGKPTSVEDAKRILLQLRGRYHSVHTSLIIINSQNMLMDRDLCSSQVEMRNYSDVEIEEYIRSGDPMDKAGAYAVQNRGFHPVVNFGGCFANVMGLPLCHLQRTLGRMGMTSVKNIPEACQAHLQYDCPIHEKVLSGLQVG